MPLARPAAALCACRSQHRHQPGAARGPAGGAAGRGHPRPLCSHHDEPAWQARRHTECAARLPAACALGRRPDLRSHRPADSGGATRKQARRGPAAAAAPPPPPPHSRWAKGLWASGRLPALPPPAAGEPPLLLPKENFRVKVMSMGFFTEVGGPAAPRRACCRAAAAGRSCWLHVGAGCWLPLAWQAAWAASSTRRLASLAG
jgi:hypothetical protein